MSRLSPERLKVMAESVYSVYIVRLPDKSVRTLYTNKGDDGVRITKFRKWGLARDQPVRVLAELGGLKYEEASSLCGLIRYHKYRTQAQIESALEGIRGYSDMTDLQYEVHKMREGTDDGWE